MIDNYINVFPKLLSNKGELMCIQGLTSCFQVTEAVTGGVLWKNMFVKTSQNSQENTCLGVSFLIKLNNTGVFLWILWNFKNNFFTEHLRTTALYAVNIFSLLTKSLLILACMCIGYVSAKKFKVFFSIFSVQYHPIIPAGNQWSV